MSMLSDPAKFTASQDGRILVEFIDLPRFATDGKDEREEMKETIDALGSDLSVRLSRREDIPTPSAVKRGRRQVPVPLWLAPKLAVHKDHGRRGRRMARKQTEGKRSHWQPLPGSGRICCGR